ncbi:hypothetical protein DSM101010T_14530 [Desulfovibrio subterraneus]|uniref:Uncharacterized protein n=1 Tax=Desulfovibrio subterraneus TaxID=2718620 RepID=A0A7J0BHP7_9BACT|nr:hypothetical protein DSM101010T_14530 [Desulfovibrio subterraneus]
MCLHMLAVDQHDKGDAAQGSRLSQHIQYDGGMSEIEVQNQNGMMVTALLLKFRQCFGLMDSGNKLTSFG